MKKYLVKSRPNMRPTNPFAVKYKQSQMLQSAMTRERAMRQQIADLQHDIEWYRVALANALEERGNRMVMHPVKGSFNFRLEYNISDEPILILEVSK